SGSRGMGKYSEAATARGGGTEGPSTEATPPEGARRRESCPSGYFARSSVGKRSAGSIARRRRRIARRTSARSMSDCSNDARPASEQPPAPRSRTSGAGASARASGAGGGSSSASGGGSSASGGASSASGGGASASGGASAASGGG